MSSNDSQNTDFQDEWLSGYLDGELDASQRAKVEERLANDENTRLELEELQQLREMVGSLPTWPGGWSTLTSDAEEPASVATMGEGNEEDSRALASGDPEANVSQESFDDELSEATSIDESPLPDDDLPELAAPVSLPKPVEGKKSGSWLRFGAIAASLIGIIGLSYPYWFPTLSFQNTTQLAGRSGQVDDSPADDAMDSADDELGVLEELPLPAAVNTTPPARPTESVEGSDAKRELLDKIASRDRTRDSEPALAMRTQQPAEPAAAGALGAPFEQERATVDALAMQADEAAPPVPSMRAMSVEPLPEASPKSENNAFTVPAAPSDVELNLQKPQILSSEQFEIAVGSPWTPQSAEQALRLNRMLLRFTQQRTTSAAQPNNVELLVATLPSNTNMNSLRTSIEQQIGIQINPVGKPVLLFVDASKLNPVAALLKAGGVSGTALLRIKPAEGAVKKQRHAVIVLRFEEPTPK